MIVILSPQDWSHQFISKHHYAVEFSKSYSTIFVSPTVSIPGKFSFTVKKTNPDNPNLLIAQLTLPFPNWFRFKFNKLYCYINRIVLNTFLRKEWTQQIKLLIDFGCHKSIDRLDKFGSKSTIFFPVDDHINLPIETRFADRVFTVSSKIQEKFEHVNIPITWINHGLSSLFAEKAEGQLKDLEHLKEKFKLNRKQVGYSGNVTIPFLDRKVVLHTIKSLPNVDFNFFGYYSSKDEVINKFINELQQLRNVKLHGQLNTEKLVDELYKMDILWLCYKADGKNYHLENSHKILEYLSTGKPIVSSPISYLHEADKDFIYQDDNSKHVDLIYEIINKEDRLDSIKERIQFALNSTYAKNINTLLN